MKESRFKKTKIIQVRFDYDTEKKHGILPMKKLKRC